MNDELRHYGVPGMKWGVRKAQSRSGKSGSTKKTKSADETNAESTKKSMKERAIARAKKTVSKENVAKAVGKGAEVCAKMATASVVDDVFYGGAGKKIAKETVKQTGRAVVTAYTMAKGGYDIRWYDN